MLPEIVTGIVDGKFDTFIKSWLLICPALGDNDKVTNSDWISTNSLFSMASSIILSEGVDVNDSEADRNESETDWNDSETDWNDSEWELNDFELPTSNSDMPEDIVLWVDITIQYI